MRIRSISILVPLLFAGLLWVLPIHAAEASPAHDKSDAPPTVVVIKPEGNQMKYATTEFTVKPGQEMRLVFANTADNPAMIHNVVLLTTSDNTVVREVGQAGASAGASANYVPDHDAILAATDVADPGETVEVTFTAPKKPTEYTCLCTYPGHWATMQGAMRVEN